MFTLIYFGSATISPHSITLNRLKQWSFFCHPFMRQALPSLRCSWSPLCTCSSLSLSFLTLSDWDGTEQSRGGFASPYPSEDHIFYLFRCHITFMAQLSRAYLNASIFFLPWWSLTNKLPKCSRKIIFWSLTQNCLSQIKWLCTSCSCISSFFCCSTRGLLSGTAWEPLWPFTATWLKGHQNIFQIKNLPGGAGSWCWNKWTWLTGVARVSLCF